MGSATVCRGGSRCIFQNMRITSKFGEEEDGDPANRPRRPFPGGIAVEGERGVYHRAAPPGGKIGMRWRMQSGETQQLRLQENKTKLDSIARRGRGSRKLQQETATEIGVLRVEFWFSGQTTRAGGEPGSGR